MTDHVSWMDGLTPDTEMRLVGYVVAGGVALLLPVLPFVTVLWLVLQLAGSENEETEVLLS